LLGQRVYDLLAVLGKVGGDAEVEAVVSARAAWWCCTPRRWIGGSAGFAWSGR